MTPPISPSPTGRSTAMSLKHLTKKLLSQGIQVGKNGPSSVEDTQATMELYELAEVEWEYSWPRTPQQISSSGNTRDEMRQRQHRAQERQGKGRMDRSTSSAPLGASIDRERKASPQT